MRGPANGGVRVGATRSSCEMAEQRKRIVLRDGRSAEEVAMGVIGALPGMGRIWPSKELSWGLPKEALELLSSKDAS